MMRTLPRTVSIGTLPANTTVNFRVAVPAGEEARFDEIVARLTSRYRVIEVVDNWIGAREGLTLDTFEAKVAEIVAS